MVPLHSTTVPLHPATVLLKKKMGAIFFLILAVPKPFFSVTHHPLCGDLGSILVLYDASTLVQYFVHYSTCST